MLVMSSSPASPRGSVTSNFRTLNTAHRLLLKLAVGAVDEKLDSLACTYHVGLMHFAMVTDSWVKCVRVASQAGDCDCHCDSPYRRF